MNLSDVCEELNEIRDVFSFQNTSLGSLEQLSSPMVRPHAMSTTFVAFEEALLKVQAAGVLKTRAR